MPVKGFKPITPGRRQMTVSTFEEITAIEPEKSLVEPLKKNAGRNNEGHMTVRHRGGGHKRLYRKIDFKRDKDGIPPRSLPSIMILIVRRIYALLHMRMVKRDIPLHHSN